MSCICSSFLVDGVVSGTNYAYSSLHTARSVQLLHPFPLPSNARPILCIPRLHPSSDYIPQTRTTSVARSGCRGEIFVSSMRLYFSLLNLRTPLFRYSLDGLLQFLTTFTVSLMKSIDIRAESAIKLLAEFLDMDTPYVDGGRHINAEHFAHGKLDSFLECGPYHSPRHWWIDRALLLPPITVQ